MTTFYPVPSDHIHLVWDQVAPKIQTVADRAGTYTVEDIAQRLLKETAQLWVALRNDRVVMACVTEINDYKRRECNILICAGSRRQDWIGFLEHIKEWARAEGCQAMTLTGRKGWQRVLRDWKLAAVELECLL